MHINVRISVPMLTHGRPEQDRGYLLLFSILLHGESFPEPDACHLATLSGKEVLCLPNLGSGHLAAMLFTLVLGI